MQDMGIKDPKRIYTAEELAPGKNIVFAATGVTDGPLLEGVRFFGDGVRTSSLVMKLQQPQGAIYREHPPQQGSGRQGAHPVASLRIREQTSGSPAKGGPVLCMEQFPAIPIHLNPVRRNSPPVIFSLTIRPEE